MVTTKKAPKTTKPRKARKPRAPKKAPVWRTHLLDGDEGRNRLFTKSSGKTITIYLNLQADGTRKRKVGVVTISTRTIVIRRNRTEHLFRAGNAYGFNSHLLHNTKTFDTIQLSDEYQNWKVPVKFILENGEYLMFKQQGFEKQIFVSLEQLADFKVLPKEGRRL